ncbi:hypothetical protein [Acinetobacter sp. Marseille-Q1618]|uniref:hypothetical protein n=1 Tax=Acinetobacter sp. Marseille-Q1618 TaxID=2697502 RepID=UPI00156F552E|nr:hypothetical protein [Acinetobacter sp. Marseille-Q1618]
MIEVKISELSYNGEIIKKIIFSSELQFNFRTVYQTLNGVPLLERVCLDSTRNEISTITILVGTDYKVVAFRKIIRDSDDDLIIFEDYKLVNNEFILIHRYINEPLNPSDIYSKRKCSAYDGKGKLHYILINSIEYDADGNERSEDTPLENFETIDDIEMQYLDEAVQKLLLK